MGVEMSEEQLETSVAVVGDGGFTSTQIAFVKTLVQNFVFTTEQVAKLLECFSMDSDKLDALKEFEGHVSNPGDADVVGEVFSFSSDKEAALALLGGFSPAKAGTLQVHAIEDDGHRSEEDMAALLARLADCSMSSDRLEALKAEVAEKPNPPLDADQLVQVLEAFDFSSDKAEALQLFVGPKLVYDMPCTQIVEVLQKFGMSSDQMELLPHMKAFIQDPQNKLTIVASFSFSSDKEKAEEILRDVVVDLTPPGPTPEQQAALQRVGSCVSGYPWRQVEGGFRCAAGGHYVSDAQLAAAM